MDKFNPYILLVMRWLQNSDLVSEEELKRNRSAAYAAYNAAFYASSHAAYHAAYNASSASSAAYRAVGADDDAKHWLIEIKERLNKYFELTKEDREAYENRAKHLNVLGVNNE